MRSFAVVGLNLSSLPYFALQHPNRICIVYVESDRTPAVIPDRNCTLNNNLYLHLVHAQSVQGVTYNLSSIYVTSYH
jgi:hypothetical protein